MQNYQFCFLGKLGQIVSEQRLRAADDAEALELARLLAHPFSIEVRQGDRRVGMWLAREKGGRPAS